MGKEKNPLEMMSTSEKCVKIGVGSTEQNAKNIIHRRREQGAGSREQRGKY